MPDSEQEQDNGATRDLTLLRRAAGGDREAYGTFVRAHQDSLYRYATLLCGDRVEAEDVLQDTFINAMRSAGQYRGEASARRWLFVIARNALIRRRRLRAGEPAHLDSLDTLGAKAGWGDPSTPDHVAQQLAQRATLSAALQRLAAEDREVLLLRDLEGLTNEEAAQTLAISVAALKSRLHRARLRLAAAVRGGVGGDHA